MTNHNNSNLHQDIVNKELLRAINADNLDYVKYLLTSPELIIHADITYNDNRCFEIACGSGRLEIVKYLINSPEVKFKVSKKALIIQGINFSVVHNQLDLLDYFRNEARSTETISQTELLKENFTILENACSMGHLKVVDYIFKNSKVPSKVVDNYSENINKLFEKCVYDGQADLIRYFIFAHDVPKTDSVQKLLDDITGPEKKEINSLFELRETNKSLQKELVNNEPNRIKPSKI